ncbi:MAG: hypothetical protein V3V84_02440, partial [Candidatus Bathyarchaeia archaeon]
ADCGLCPMCRENEITGQSIQDEPFEIIRRTETFDVGAISECLGTDRILPFNIKSANDSLEFKFPKHKFSGSTITDAKIILVTYHIKDQNHAE